MNEEKIWKVDRTKNSVLGLGGTKSVYLVDQDTAVFLPNCEDGQWLIRMWPRIVNEEMAMSQLLQEIGIPTQKLTKCLVLFNQRALSTYSAPTFSSYIKDGIYVIDAKNIQSIQWPNDQSLSLFPKDTDRYDVKAWMNILSSLIQDIQTLVNNRVYLGSDSLNLVFVAKGSYWHSSRDLPYEVRIFGFDFSSKSWVLDLQNRQILREGDIYSMVYRAIELAVYGEMTQRQWAADRKQSDFAKTLSDLIVDKIVQETDIQENIEPDSYMFKLARSTVLFLSNSKTKINNFFK